MHYLRHVAVVVSTLLVMLVGSTAFMAQAETVPWLSEDGGTHHCPTTDRSASTTTAPPALEQYYLDDWRFGPQNLPDEGALGEMFDDYDRLGGSSPEDFLACYWNTETEGWWYPDQDGFVLDKTGEPVKKPVELAEGDYLDLFGSGFGRFLAPAGTDYEERAIPPSNANTWSADYPFSYRLYEVLKPFTVDAGPIRPWFGQPGSGLQYVVNAEYIPDAPDVVNIPYLVENGYLRQVN